MAVDQRNILTSGLTGAGSSNDPVEACLPYSSGIIRDIQPLAREFGLADVMNDPQLKSVANWKADSVFTGSAAATPLALIAATSTSQAVLRVTSSTDASDILGNTQIQAGGTSAAVVARFFPRTDNLIHFVGRLKWSNNAGATLVGLANVATGLMAAAGTVSANLTDGLYVYRAPASATITAFVRRGGVTKASVALTTTAAAGTTYVIGFRFNTTDVIFSLDGVEFPLTLASDGSDAPNAAITPTVIQGGNARTMDILRLYAGQEAA